MLMGISSCCNKNKLTVDYGRTKKMRKCYTIIVLLFIISFLVSCSTVRYNIKRNKDLTVRQVNYFYKKNGNAFYLCSTYATFSVVWTYDEDNFQIYRLQEGRIRQKQIFKSKDIIQYAVVSLEDLEDELYRKCALELDGDSFGFKVEIDRKTYIADYAVNINCMKQGKYESNFLNKITNDIKIHKMWEVEYQ